MLFPWHTNSQLLEESHVTLCFLWGWSSREVVSQCGLGHYSGDGPSFLMLVDPSSHLLTTKAQSRHLYLEIWVASGLWIYQNIVSPLWHFMWKKRGKSLKMKADIKGSCYLFSLLRCIFIINDKEPQFIVFEGIMFTSTGNNVSNQCRRQGILSAVRLWMSLHRNANQNSYLNTKLLYKSQGQVRGHCTCS